MKPKKREPSARLKAAQVAEVEWNFGNDKDGNERVPEEQLVACCYWEYARESSFIRRVVQRMKDVDQRKVAHPLVTEGKPWVQTHCLRLLEGAGVKMDLPTLRLGAQLDYSRYFKQMSETQPSLLVRGGGGVDSLVAQINWREFSDTEILESFKRWLKDTRPIHVKEELKGAKPGRGHDEDEWRARLERLGLLRLRCHHTFTRARPFLSMLPQTTKTTNASECNREAKKAVRDFHALFPFLNSAEQPRCLPIK